MFSNPPYYSPEGSNDLFDSITGELIFSTAKNPIYRNSTFDFIKEEIYKENAYRDLHNKRKLHKIVDAFISSDREIKINTPPPPFPDFLPRVYRLQQLALQNRDLFDFENSLPLL